MKKKILYRSLNDRLFLGLLGGLGEYFSINPLFFRLAFLLIGLYTLGFPILIPYLLSSIFIPSRPKPLSQLDYLPIYRSYHNRFLGGIFGGISERFDVDANILRLLFLVFAIPTIFPLICLYLFSWFLLPLKKEEGYS